MGVSPSLSASNALARSRSLAGILVATLLSSSTGASLLRLGPPPPAVGCHRRLRNAPAARLQGRAAPRGGGSGDAGGRGEQVGGDVAEGWGAAEGEAPLQLLAVAVQDGLDSAGATGGEAPDDGAPEQDGSGAQRQGLDDAVATAPSSWRPPWLETTTAAAPASRQATASSPRSTPLTTTGRRDCSRSQAIASGVTVGSKCLATPTTSTRSSGTARFASPMPGGSWNWLRLSRSRLPGTGTSAVSTTAW